MTWNPGNPQPEEGENESPTSKGLPKTSFHQSLLKGDPNFKDKKKSPTKFLLFFKRLLLLSMTCLTVTPQLHQKPLLPMTYWGFDRLKFNFVTCRCIVSYKVDYSNSNPALSWQPSKAASIRSLSIVDRSSAFVLCPSRGGGLVTAWLKLLLPASGCY